MKYRANASEPFQELYIKALDSMPVGTIVEYTGQASDIPVGWEAISGGKIQKTSETTPTMASIVNTKNNSTTDGYSCKFINDHLGGVILYDDATGTTGNITLSDDASNYEYLDIYYRDNNDRWSYQRVYQPNGKNVEIDNAYIDNAAIFFRANLISISGTTITKLFYSQFSHEGQNMQNTNANFYITRVVGYK